MTTIGELIEWSAHNYGDKQALVYPRKQQNWTYSQLNEKVNQFAYGLQQLGVKKGDTVSTFLYNTSEFVIALFASAKIGAIFNPINYRLTAHELHFILQDANSAVLLYEEEVANIVEQTKELGLDVKQFIYVDEQAASDDLSFYELLQNEAVDNPPQIVTENDLYIMMYTSGTTGKPKGVLHKHRDMVHHNFLMMQAMGLTKNDRGLSIAPLNHTAELHTSFLPRVQVGATNVILHSFQAEEVLQTLEKERITQMFAAPTMVNMLLNHESFSDFDLSALRLVEYGGASMAPALIKQWLERTSAELVQIYGTTEMGPAMSVLYSDEQLSKAGSAGKPMLTHQIKVVRTKADGSPSHPNDECDVNEVGELIVKGPCMMKEYANRKEATEEALAYGWYHTGDIGYVDEDGYLWIKDRIDHMIVSGAENVYPREVEDRLIEHPDVLEVAVVGKPDPTWGEIVVAFIVTKGNKDVLPDVFDTFLLEGNKLARYKRPREYYLVDALPKTPSGKIQKFILEDRVAQP